MSMVLGLILTGLVVVVGAAGMAAFLIWVRIRDNKRRPNT